MQNFETGRQVGLGQPLLWVAVQSSSGLRCTGAVTEAKQFCLSNNLAIELQAKLEVVWFPNKGEVAALP